MSIKLTKMDVNCARSRSGLDVSSDSIMGVRKCWRVRVNSGRENQKHTTHGVNEVKAPEVRSFGFIKFVDNSSSFFAVAIGKLAPSCATPSRGVESGGG